MTNRLRVAAVTASLGLAAGIGVWHVQLAAQTRQGGQPAAAPAAAQAAPNPCAAPANKIIAENCKPGRPREEWDIFANGDPFIQGFSTDISYNVGETAQFKIKKIGRAHV